MFAVEAKKRMLKGAKDPEANLPQAKRAEQARDQAADVVSVSPRMVQYAKAIKTTNPKAFKKIKLGQLTVNQVLKEIKKEKRKADINKQKEDIKTGAIKMPEGVFEVVVMDPPWNYGRDYDPEGSRIANPYPEMPQADLLKLSPPFANDCVLFLWTTHAFIWDAKQLIDAWGFQYKATLVWDKEKMGMGAWLRMQCEFCLVAIKGKPTWTNTNWRDIIKEPRRQHSRKPDTFYNLVEEVTVGRRLDFFSREQRSGWASFGNDEHKFSN
jgi:N6-adenosine-specific RNA methylase IME4